MSDYYSSDSRSEPLLTGDWRSKGMIGAKRRLPTLAAILFGRVSDPRPDDLGAFTVFLGKFGFCAKVNDRAKRVYCYVPLQDSETSWEEQIERFLQTEGAVTWLDMDGTRGRITHAK